MPEAYILAIDQGTTGSTVLLFDREGSIRGRAYSEFTQHYPRAGWVEHDAEELWCVTLSVVEAALNDAGANPAGIRAIGITNQRETSLLWHRADSRPAARAIVWQDRRTASLCDELRQEGLEPVWQQKTGLLIDPYFSGTKVRWMLDHLPGLRERAVNGDLAFGTIDTWLVWKLTGGACHVTDYSNASRTLLYNIRELDWDTEILARLGIPAAILPEVKPSSCVYGETDPGAFFGQRVPIAGIAGDQQAALFGQACYVIVFMPVGNRPWSAPEDGPGLNVYRPPQLGTVRHGSRNRTVRSTGELSWPSQSLDQNSRIARTINGYFSDQKTAGEAQVHLARHRWRSCCSGRRRGDHVHDREGPQERRPLLLCRGADRRAR